MPRTPDRREGPLYEEGIYMETTALASTPGEMRFDGSRFSMVDAMGEFDPRTGGSSVLFGTEYQYTSSEGTSTTTGTTYVQKVRLTTTSLPAGNYIILWYAELACSAANRDWQIRVQVDDTTNLCETGTREVIKGYYAFASGFQVTSLTAGPHNIDLDFRRPGGSSATITIRRARLALWRVS